MSELFGCRLNEFINNERKPTTEKQYAKAVLRKHIEIASEEVGDTLEPGEPLLSRLGQTVGLYDTDRQAFVCKVVTDCLSYRYLGKCGNGSCRGSVEISELIEEIAVEVR